MKYVAPGEMYGEPEWEGRSTLWTQGLTQTKKIFIWNLVCGEEIVSCKWQTSWGYLLLQHDLPYPGSQDSWPLLLSWRSEIERPSCAIGVHCVRGWNLRRAEGGTAHCDCCTPDTIHGFPVTPPVLIFLQTDFHFMNKESTASLVYKLGKVTSLISDKTKS